MIGGEGRLPARARSLAARPALIVVGDVRDERVELIGEIEERRMRAGDASTTARAAAAATARARNELGNVLQHLVTLEDGLLLEFAERHLQPSAHEDASG